MRALPLLLTACSSVAKAPDATTTPAPAAPSIFDRLHDTAGRVPGLDGYSLARVPDATRCGGIAVTVVHAANVRVAPADQPLAAFFDTPPITGLDFGDAAKDQSRQRFDTWLADAGRRAEAARAAYEGASSDATIVISAARDAQVLRHFASMLLRAEIPADVRAGEHADDKIAAYCGALTNAATPLLAKADEAVARCAEHVTRVGSGWWSSVCIR